MVQIKCPICKKLAEKIDEGTMDPLNQRIFVRCECCENKWSSKSYTEYLSEKLDLDSQLKLIKYFKEDPNFIMV